MRTKEATVNERVRFIKFLLVGCSNVIMSFGVFYVLYEHWRIGSIVLGTLGTLGEEVNRLLLVWGIESVDGTVATVSGYLCGTVNSFLWNRAWTFKSNGSMAGQFPRFLLLNVLCLLFSALSMLIFVDAMNFPYLIVWLTTMSLVTIANFFGNKWWVFKKQFHNEPSPKTEAFLVS